MARPQVTRSQVLAWRLSAHGLHARLPTARRAEAVRPAGLRTGGPDSALIGWHARAEGIGVDDVRAALLGRTLVEAPSLRGGRLLDPADLSTVTAGALPVDEEALNERLRRRGFAPTTDPVVLVRDGTAAARAALSTGPRTIAELSQAVTAALPAEASSFCAPCAGVHVDIGLFGMIALTVAWVRAAGLADGAFVAPEQWLSDAPTLDARAGAAALLAWHLRANSPTTPSELAAFLGVGSAEATRRWTGAPELAEVDYEGRRTWVPAAHLDDLRAAVRREGVRILPPYDAALDAPDKATVVPDRAQQKEVWRVVANSGIALVDGAVSCAWRARKHERRLTVTLTALDGWTRADRPRLERELAVVAQLRGAELTELVGP